MAASMRAFAEFVMRGRLQATGVCIACGILPFVHWVAIAVIALVVLRKGLLEGALLMLWTGLPLAAWLLIGPDPSVLLVLVGTFGLALLLRTTLSWQWVLAGAVAVAVASALVIEHFAGGWLQQTMAWYADLLKSTEARQPDLTDDQLRHLLVGLLAMGQAYAMIVCLVLARWWQSLLYNPGGFRQEFHNLRLSPALSWGLIGLTVLLFAVGDPTYARWIPLLTVPMIVSAIGLVHWIVAKKKLSGNWLVVFYILLLGLIQVIYPVMASLALIDSWIDVRKRIEFGEHEDEV